MRGAVGQAAHRKLQGGAAFSHVRGAAENRNVKSAILLGSLPCGLPLPIDPGADLVLILVALQAGVDRVGPAQGNGAVARGGREHGRSGRDAPRRGRDRVRGRANLGAAPRPDAVAVSRAVVQSGEPVTRGGRAAAKIRPVPEGGGALFLLVFVIEDGGVAGIGPGERDLGIACGGHEARGRRQGIGIGRRHDCGGRVAVLAARGRCACVHRAHLEGVFRAVVQAPDGVGGGIDPTVGAVGNVGPRPVVGAAVRGLPDLVLGDLEVVQAVRVAAGRVNGVPGERHRAPASVGREVGRGGGLARGGGQWGIGHIEGQSPAFGKHRIRRRGTNNGKHDLDRFRTLKDDRIVWHLNPVVVCPLRRRNVRYGTPLKIINVEQTCAGCIQKGQCCRRPHARVAVIQIEVSRCHTARFLYLNNPKPCCGVLWQVCHRNRKGRRGVAFRDIH